jgi:hypothetical protein
MNLEGPVGELGWRVRKSAREGHDARYGPR